MKVEKLLAQKAVIERQIEEQKAIEKSFEKAKKVILGLVEKNPKIALVDREVLQKKFSAFLSETIAGI